MTLRRLFQRWVKPRLYLPPVLLVTQKRQAWQSAQAEARARLLARLERR